MTEQEFKNSVDRNSHRIFLIAFSYTKSQADAEDIMQNTFLKLWRFNASFENDEHIDKWLTRVCVNECKDYFRLISRKRTASLDDVISVASNDEYFNIDLFNAVLSLSKKERMVVHLFYYEELSIIEISRLTKIKESTVKSMLRRSREKLRNLLGDEWIYEK